ncbi:glutamate N-acetyltransferase [Desulfatibacillum alkenivorans DSM 16219]|jgi:glutamate N-acetyltransferase/amino-acid N-acetyltransferase|uniref:Arginine biosynthesis bifunctional protein ArgJ n=1 Tax=Desulfatibacillum alkenivorans DSM 16219 TaxID=1121393 RepID=A0A1M6LX17_9BACT|nr:bifunctional glutamate N-acetyltransferase/amino-acid acetyltransferase ArgJ [Desulfatibacillum alkenivorans]SHJ75716.1 glutamate N-acetyltransferase [Desulfatibacillum alkenivorans DSM 16219]
MKTLEKASCQGFSAAGTACGLKKNGKPDLGMIFCSVPASVAGVFTRNKVQAAPVLLDKKNISSGVCRAVVANSGCANCCTGKRGVDDAVETTRLASGNLGVDAEDVLVASTGVIGKILDVEKIRNAFPRLVDSLSPEGFESFAEAIMTTDNVPKVSAVEADFEGQTFNVVGVAKGAGMIRPDMATMLCFICTDIQANPNTLKRVLRPAVDASFNRITIDGDTSTNDTVLLMASGLSQVAANRCMDLFQQAVDKVCLDLAHMLVKDGEGVNKVVTIDIQGADSDQDARRIADVIAHSPLVKTAFFGEDANWGRLLAAAGRAGVPLDPYVVDIFFDGVQMVKDGMGLDMEAEAMATEVMKLPEFTVKIDLKIGKGQASVLTCDLSYDYIKINADYRS